jgi:hypothetical protein
MSVTWRTPAYQDQFVSRASLKGGAKLYKTHITLERKSAAAARESVYILFEYKPDEESLNVANIGDTVSNRIVLMHSWHVDDPAGVHCRDIDRSKTCLPKLFGGLGRLVELT